MAGKAEKLVIFRGIFHVYTIYKYYAACHIVVHLILICCSVASIDINRYQFTVVSSALKQSLLLHVCKVEGTHVVAC